MNDKTISTRVPSGAPTMPVDADAGAGKQGQRANVGSFHPGGVAALPDKLHLQVSTVNALLFEGDVQEVRQAAWACCPAMIPCCCCCVQVRWSIATSAMEKAIRCT